MVQNKKGAARERELVNHLNENGFAVIRAPASGSATNRELPDVIAGDGDNFWAVEAKASGGDPIYVEQHEVESLTYFAAAFGAKALIGTRFDAKHGDPHYGNDDDTGWRFYEPASLYTTDAGSFRVKKEEMVEGRTITDLKYS